ncbi:MAG: pseudaminic acid cytidylyltransferase [Bacteroidales bacterium]|nr:pseudaminic acid cytidylyltransferase [Bacteroidales bacterium]
MSNIAIIPARGGSKRIPRKNIKDFLGKPIIAYSIETALNSGLFDEVMVSTDDEEIAQIALKYGAKVPFMRSKKNANDFATLAEVIDEVVKEYTQQNRVFKYGCCILPTSPLLRIERLKEGLELIEEKMFDSVKPIVRFSYPIQRALKHSNHQVTMFNPEYAKSRSQDLEPTYHDAGQFYWFNWEQGLNGDNKGAIVVSEIEVQDIDTWDDWKLAEFKYKMIDI